MSESFQENALRRLTSSKIPDEVMNVFETLQKNNHRAFLVGGCVRDMLMGKPPSDFDVATSATPKEVMKCFRHVIPTGIDHGTVTVVVNQTHVEVTTFRSEGAYVDGRRPQSVQFETELDADLSRRDFTMNAIAFDPSSKNIVDTFSGLLDIENKIVRAVGRAFDRFSEDGLRAMRAVRFATVLDFQIEKETERAISETISVFRKVAVERIRVEFEKLIRSPHATRGLELMNSTSLFQEVLPGVSTDDIEHVVKVNSDFDMRLATLIRDAATAQKISEKLKCARTTIENVSRWNRALPPPEDKMSLAAVRQFAASVGRTHIKYVCEIGLARHQLNAPMAQQLREIADSALPLSTSELALSGTDLMQILNVSQGPVIGKVSRFLLQAVFEGRADNSAASLKQALASFDATRQ